MAKYSQHQSRRAAKVLITGDNGAGKSACLASLANAGYELFIIDFDNGLDILRSYLHPGAEDRIHYHTFRDDPSQVKATAWKDAYSVTTKGWKFDNEDCGKPWEWPDNHVLVVDSLTFGTRQVGHHILTLNNRKITEQVSLPEWGAVNRELTAFLDRITGDDYGSVIVTAQPVNVDDENGVSRVYPHIGTKNYSMEVAGFFNTSIGIKTGKQNKRVLQLVGSTRQEFKTSVAPVPPEVEIPNPGDPNYGYAKLFSVLKKESSYA